ncbi:MAG: 50S ribosomal protein L14 [Candidatus Aenigmarchaeota archaeon]|nr:50S ribosomal protein L14 [Candidatus Aenigmarchaeota archaeon]
MKAVTSSVTQGLQVGSLLTCADNTGVKEFMIISVRGFKGRRKMRPAAGVANIVMCKVYKGEEKVRHQVFKAVIIRQRKEWRRPNGTRISFEDNAAVTVDDKLEPKGTMIKGPVAKEVVERFPTIGKQAGIIV